MSNYDYTGLAEQLAGDDVVLLEWDIAVSSWDLSMFTGRAHIARSPLVAPYLIGSPGDVVHWRDEGGELRHLRPGEPDCDLFGLGLAFLPNWVLSRFPAGAHMSDGTLSRWLRDQPGWRPVPVDWGTTVVHLH